jgi:hypothetical protein
MNLNEIQNDDTDLLHVAQNRDLVTGCCEYGSVQDRGGTSSITMSLSRKTLLHRII